QVDRAKATTVQREQRELDEAKALAVKLEAVQVVLKLRSGKDGKLFGAVTNADVASALKQQHGITLDRRKIEFDEPVKAMGAGTTGGRWPRAAPQSGSGSLGARVADARSQRDRAGRRLPAAR